jgi:hypothetical protein
VFAALALARRLLIAMTMMRTALLAMMCACGAAPGTMIGGSGPTGDDDGQAPDAAQPPSGDPLAAVYAGVDPARLDSVLADMTGYNTITLDGAATKISERYTPANKAKWRQYWTAYMTALGATVNEIDFPVKNLVGETTGHDLEAVFPGTSADSIVAIVHYDSTGAPGKEAQNPGVDDNMTPMAIQMETARLLASRDRDHTLRFAATDYEEITTIEGGKAYAAALAKQGVHVIAAVDGELSGWSCWSEGKCTGTPRGKFTLATRTCDGKYDSSALGQQVHDVAAHYGTMTPDLDCDSDTDGSELYNFWKEGVPAFYFEEYDNDDNTHFDEGGGDTMAIIDATYYHQIGQTAAVMIASLVGIH